MLSTAKFEELLWARPRYGPSCAGKNQRSRGPHPQLYAINYNFRMLCCCVYVYYTYALLFLFSMCATPARPGIRLLANGSPGHFPFIRSLWAKNEKLGDSKKLLHGCEVCANFRREWARMNRDLKIFKPFA